MRCYGRDDPEGFVIRCLRVLDDVDKFLVSGLVLFLCYQHPTVRSTWTVLGALLNAVVCKIAKRLINQPRPLSARKSDAGMPSSHACSLTFLSTYGALMFWNGAADPSYAVSLGISDSTCAVAVFALGMFLSSLRLLFGHHTVPQVQKENPVLRCATGLLWE